MAEEKREEEDLTPTGEDRGFFERLRTQQRELVEKELLKEKLEVERRILEEEKKVEEAERALVSFRRAQLWKRVAVMVAIVALLIAIYLGIKQLG